ncbi:MAG: hypothetical protein EBR33_08895 [Synechococcaceae bacterium WB4_1_0192]|nr:hypothetical protein [Synechococcaceae bacterium WB4_1_0192]
MREWYLKGLFRFMGFQISARAVLSYRIVQGVTSLHFFKLFHLAISTITLTMTSLFAKTAVSGTFA